jgi:hypothetical protein
MATLKFQKVPVKSWKTPEERLLLLWNDYLDKIEENEEADNFNILQQVTEDFNRSRGSHFSFMSIESFRDKVSVAMKKVFPESPAQTSFGF